MHSQKVRVLNVDIDNLTTDELLARYNEGLLVTPNADHLMKLQKDREFYECYQQASYSVCDSRIVFLLTHLLYPKSPLRAQITGSDFFPAFCDYHAKHSPSTKIFLLGGTEASVITAQQRINERTQSEIVVGGYSPPFGFERSEQENAKVISQVNASGANVLAVGVGAPKQEKWICNNRHKMPQIKMYMAIGATIEFESGNLRRAPKWMTHLGLEWLYRMGQEPKRLIKRYLIDDLPIFILMARQRMGAYRNPWSN